MKSPRQWCRLRVSVDIRRSSIYWTATSTTQNEYKTMETVILVGGASLPPSLSKKMQAILSETERYDDDIHLHFLTQGQVGPGVPCRLGSCHGRGHKSVFDPVARHPDLLGGPRLPTVL